MTKQRNCKRTGQYQIDGLGTFCWQHYEQRRTLDPRQNEPWRFDWRTIDCDAQVAL